MIGLRTERSGRHARVYSRRFASEAQILATLDYCTLSFAFRFVSSCASGTRKVPFQHLAALTLSVPLFALVREGPSAYWLSGYAIAPSPLQLRNASVSSAPSVSKPHGTIGLDRPLNGSLCLPCRSASIARPSFGSSVRISAAAKRSTKPRMTVEASASAAMEVSVSPPPPSWSIIVPFPLLPVCLLSSVMSSMMLTKAFLTAAFSLKNPT